MSENKEYVSQIEGQSNVHISGDAICTVAAVAAVEVEGVAGLSNLGSDVAGIAAKKNLSKAIRLRTEEDVKRKQVAKITGTGGDKTVKKQPVVKKVKVGANDPCPCGSGKKYKYCCRDKDEAK